MSRDCNIEELKNSYRKLALQYHPDRNKSKEATAKFKEVTEAYAILSDPEKRAEYNRAGHTAVISRYTPQDIFANVDFEDLFQDLNIGFRSFIKPFDVTRAESTNQEASRDVQFDLEISMEQAYKGFTAEIAFPRRERCQGCKGRGRKTSPRNVTCPKCEGHSTIIRNRRIKLKVPPGVQTGSELRLRGEGDAPIGGYGPNGHLYVVINVREHQIFTREQDDLTCHIRVPLHTAIHGGEIRVPTMDGTVKVRIPAHTKTGKMLRLKSKGMPELGGKRRGHQYIVVDVIRHKNENRAST